MAKGTVLGFLYVSKGLKGFSLFLDDDRTPSYKTSGRVLQVEPGGSRPTCADWLLYWDSYFSLREFMLLAGVLQAFTPII